MQLVCLICKKQLFYDHSDITPLVQHLNQEHPRVNFSKSHQQTQQTPQKADLLTFERNSVAFRKSAEKSVQTELKLDWSKYFKDHKGFNRMENQGNQRMNQPESRKNSKEDQDGGSRRDSRKSEESRRTNRIFNKDSDDDSVSFSIKSSKESIKEPVKSTPKIKPETPPKMKSRTPPTTRPQTPPQISTPRTSKPKKSFEIPKIPLKNIEKFLENQTPVRKDPKHQKPQNQPKSPKDDHGEGDSLARRKKKLYVTSVGKWRPGGSAIVCPNCGVNKRPTIRSHKDRVSNSSCGANLILACWPFCFTPCLFPAPALEYLHCAVCNHYLGKFDHNKQLISPNPDLLKNYSAI